MNIYNLEWKLLTADIDYLNNHSILRCPNRSWICIHFYPLPQYSYGWVNLTSSLNSSSGSALCKSSSHQAVQCWPMILTSPQRLFGSSGDWSFLLIKEVQKAPLSTPLMWTWKHVTCVLPAAILTPWGIIQRTNLRMKPRLKHIDGKHIVLDDITTSLDQ